VRNQSSSFFDAEGHCYWWCISEPDTFSGYCWYLDYRSIDFLWMTLNKSLGLSVRLLRND
jgi:hypothetical protein